MANVCMFPKVRRRMNESGSGGRPKTAQLFNKLQQFSADIKVINSFSFKQLSQFFFLYLIMGRRKSGKDKNSFFSSLMDGSVFYVNSFIEKFEDYNDEKGRKKSLFSWFHFQGKKEVVKNFSSSMRVESN